MSSAAAASPQAQAAPAAPRVVAHKFGGTSVADAERYRHVAQLLLQRPETEQITVVSAMKGVTDGLIDLAKLAADGNAQWREAWHALRARHRGAAVALLGEQSGQGVEWLDARFDELAQVLEALAVIGGLPREVLDRVQGLGEVCSAFLLGQYLQALGEACAVLDARDVLVVEHGDLGVNVDWDVSAQRLQAWRQRNPQPRVVVTGFIARDRQDRITTLGRNGSDYSGAIFAALFNAEELQIWTDVDGVLSADPRLVPEAVQLEALSYDEACELAYFGAKVVHPQTMYPAIERGLPILIRNTFQPEHPGTRITAQRSIRGPIKGLTLSSELAVVNLEGTGLIGVPGTAERVFSALRQAHVSVVMISQGSSEHSICCVVRGSEANRARDALLQSFAGELAGGQVQRVHVTGNVSVLAAVGDGMAGQPGVAARLFEALGKARVNILAIAQGSSERNISVAISGEDATRALRAAHAGFWLSPQTFAVGVIGPGNVGAALLDQLQAEQPSLLAKANIDLRLRAVASRSGMHLAPRAVQGDWRAALAGQREASDLDRFTAHLLGAHLPHAVVIDCSGSAEVAERYADWLAAGIHVVTPNKQAGSGPLARYQRIRAAAAGSGARFRYEATVGAGLPVITTLRDLVDTGDEVLAIEGIFSGTLAWLFNSFDGSQPFSELVAKARGMGYTEPDPRDDLSGVDVARKLVILAREAGRELSLEQVKVQSLVPEALREGSVEQFMADLGQSDAQMLQRLQQARERGAVLRYVAALTAEGASVGLVEVPAAHAFGNLQLTDNVVQFRTRRYCDNPLVVQGPGAGPEVTAAGVFADLLRVAAGEGGTAVIARAFSPASVGNVAVGFDILGHAIEGVGDTVTVQRIDAPEVRIEAITGTTVQLPLEAARNTAGAALIALREALELPFGFSVHIEKGIALGSGMGGSAASCVAALVAANALLDTPLDRHALYPFALEGEQVASGGRHGDNLGPMLLGGLVLSTADRLVPVPVPAQWHSLLVHPDAVLETRRARQALQGNYALSEFVAQSSNLALVLAGCHQGDAGLVRAGLRDDLVEPRRAPLITGFQAARDAALQAGAMGASISGAGPSVFAWFEHRAEAEAAAAVVQAAFAAHGQDSQAWVSSLAAPAAVLL